MLLHVQGVMSQMVYILQALHIAGAQPHHQPLDFWDVRSQVNREENHLSLSSGPLLKQ